jgi:nucleoside-diphosphate-sugar epimerase
MNGSRTPFPDTVIFGGAGFIGLHLTRHLIAGELAERVWLVDLRAPELNAFPQAVRDVAGSDRVRIVTADVRRPLEALGLPERAHLAVNLAAVHREPGHAPHEYYETNLAGAENVCAWAERVDCRRVAFTSSIAIYGPGGGAKHEGTVPVPETPYGGSKLAAEHIHRAWQRAGAGRRLLIVRPGVIYGPGEGGNVTRLVRAVLGRYFAYTGNRGVRKAGGYVKELCNALTWGLQRLEETPQGVSLFNFSMDPPPSVAEYVEAICRVAGVRRRVPTLPYGLLLAAAYALEALARPVGLRQPVSPVRVRKLVRSTEIEPRALRSAGYPWVFTLEQALADWQADWPHDWR